MRKRLGHFARMSLLASSSLLPSAAIAADPDALEALVQKQSSLIASQAEMIGALQARVTALEARTAPDQHHEVATAVPVSLTSKIAASDPGVLSSRATTAGFPLPLAPAPDHGPVGSVSWSNGGPTFTGPDGSTFHVRGRLWLDASTTSGSRYDARDISGTEVRSFRLGADGRWGDHFAYKAEVDFADSTVSIKDLYVAWLGKLGPNDLEVYAGNKLGDRGIDDSTPDETMPFQERNEVATGIGPEKGVFGMGLLGKLIGKDWSASLNVVGDDANNNPGTASDSVAYISRVQWTPAIVGDLKLHLGVTGYYEELSAGARTLNRIAYDTGHFNDNVRITETPVLNATHSTNEAGEAGIIAGPFWAMTEYGRRTISTMDGDPRRQHAFAAYGGLFLTGEKTNFLQRTGTWVRVQPNHPVTEGGWGAFELLARYETLDLGPINVAGHGTALTAATNWYPNATSRVMLSFVHWTIDNPIGPYIGKDAGNSVNIRLQTAF